MAAKYECVRPYKKRTATKRQRFESCEKRESGKYIGLQPCVEACIDDDDEKREVAEYRDQLYQHLRDLRKDSVARMGYFGAVRGAARLRAGVGRGH